MGLEKIDPGRVAQAQQIEAINLTYQPIRRPNSSW